MLKMGLEIKIPKFKFPKFKFKEIDDVEDINLEKEKERYNILRQLGIREKDLQKIITKKIYSILVLPGIMAIINGVVFFGMDVFQNAENKVTKTLLLEYILVVLIFAFIEYLGSYVIRKRVQKLHEKLD